MYCPCGNMRCLCLGRCRCCSCICYCTACSSLRGYQDQLCHRCINSRDCPSSASTLQHSCVPQPVIQPWVLAGVYPNLDFLSTNSLEPSVASGEKMISQVPRRRKSSEDDDDFLIFQMDDINSSSDKDSTNASADSIVRDLPESSQSNPDANVSKLCETQVIEMPIIRDLPTHSQFSSNVTVPSDIVSTNPSAVSVIRDLSGCSQSNPVVTISKRKESQVTEMPTIQDLPGHSQFKSDATVSEPAESQMIENASDVAPSVSGDESLPSDLSDDSSSSESSASPESSTHQMSTSAPSIFDVPQSIGDLESSKPNGTVTLTISERSLSSNLLKFEKLGISDSHSIDKARTESETSSSIGNVSMDLPPVTLAIGQSPELPLNFVPTYSFDNALSSIKAMSMGQTSRTSPMSSSPTLSSLEILKSARQKRSSESSSSIETISIEPLAEKSDDESSTSPSPNKDSRLED